MRFLSLLSLAITVGAVSVHGLPYSVPTFVPGLLSYVPAPAPLHAQDARTPIKGSYMVIFKQGVDATTLLAHRESVHAAQAASLMPQEGAGIRHVYDLDDKFQGYAGAFSEDVLAYIRAHPAVEYVEQDTVVTTQEMAYNNNRVFDVPYKQTLEEAFKTQDGEFGAMTIEKGSPWVSVQYAYSSAALVVVIGLHQSLTLPITPYSGSRTRIAPRASRLQELW